MKKWIFLLIASFPLLATAQNVTVNITLLANEGGAHTNMLVTMVNTATNEKYSGTTDISGKVSIAVPANANYQVLIPNYTDKKFINVPNAPGATMSSTMHYSRNMVQQSKDFAMSDPEKAAVDAFANNLPDTTFFRGSNPFQSASTSYYSRTRLCLFDFNEQNLAGEIVMLTGRKRHKTFKATTDASGCVVLYLPKGDDYDLSFQYHKNFEYTECKYSKGTSEVNWEFEYIGTKEYLRKKKEDDDRQAAELKAIADAKLAGEKLREERIKKPYAQNELAQVLDRNKFKNPLIICDASAQMELINTELMGWFNKNAVSNPNAQIVFFNDGDAQKETEKKIGATGGLYYTPMLALDKLKVFMFDVIDKSKDEGGADNYMEALIQGVKMAKKPYSDIVLIVDNHATARDIELLSQFNQPVHVVVFCSIRGGCDHSFCQPDFLKIAYKTKGTLHIDGIDYNAIGNMKNDEIIEIGAGKGKMKLLNGEFFRL
jgi:hypothetical protein